MAGVIEFMLENLTELINDEIFGAATAGALTAFSAFVLLKQNMELEKILWGVYSM